VTSIHGLEAFGENPLLVSIDHSTTDWIVTGVNLKKAAQLFATRFACGSSVTKNALELDEIVVQGDVSGDILKMIEEQVGVLKGVPAGNVVEVEESELERYRQEVLWLREENSWLKDEITKLKVKLGRAR